MKSFYDFLCQSNSKLHRLRNLYKKKKKKKEKKWKGEKEKMFVQSYGTNILEKWESMAGWKWK